MSDLSLLLIFLLIKQFLLMLFLIWIYIVLDDLIAFMSIQLLPVIRTIITKQILFDLQHGLIDLVGRFRVIIHRRTIKVLIYDHSNRLHALIGV